MSDRWDGRQAGFGVSDGEWWARIMPVSNDPNLVGVRQDVVVLTPAGLAEVERAAAERALTDAAEQFATQDGIEALMFAHDDVTAVQATEKWLRKRAAALGLMAGQEGETE